MDYVVTILLLNITIISSLLCADSVEKTSLKIKNIEAMLNRCEKYGESVVLVTVALDKRTNYVSNLHKELEQLRTKLERLQEHQDDQDIKRAKKEFEKYLNGPCSYKDRKLKGKVV